MLIQTLRRTHVRWKANGSSFRDSSINGRGEWLDLTSQYNHSSDISPTAGQIPRSVGLALTSKIYRNMDSKIKNKFTVEGNEICWATIGNPQLVRVYF